MENLIEEPEGYECCDSGEEYIFYDEIDEGWCMEIENKIMIVRYCPFCGREVE